MNLVFKELSKIISPIYLVGGAVRDQLMGIVSKDYDFATPLKPDTVLKNLQKAKKKTFLIGKRFGTIGTLIKGHHVEITTFRSEIYNYGCRKPEVTYSRDIYKDLSRRDFTINSMAVSEDKIIIDPYNGQKDIKKKIIKCVGSANKRLKEDPLRMLRALRFVSQLGFNITLDIKKGIKQNAFKINNVSRERWLQEMDKLLLGENFNVSLKLLSSTKLFENMLKDFSIKKTIRSFYFTQKDSIDIRWALLLKCIIPKKSISIKLIKDISLHLRWSRKRRKVVLNTLMEGNGPARSLKQLNLSS